MKAMMSDKLRNILNDPKRARELQKELARSSLCTYKEDQRENEVTKSFFHADQRPKQL